MTKQQETLLRKWQLLSPYLSRRQQSFWAAVEAEIIGPRGRMLLTKVTGNSTHTLAMRTREMILTKGAPLGSLVHSIPGHYRSGRKLVEVKDPDIENALELLVSNEIAGEPTNNQRWVRSSLRRLSALLGKEGHQACTHTVARLLRKKGYSLRVIKKRHAGTKHPDRDKQFQYIAALKASYLAEGLPVISIDTKKRELVGNFRREGTSWQKEPIEVVAYYASARQCVAIPFGIYNVALNAGYVSVGISANTSEFAVNCLESWWRDYGKLGYPRGNRLLIFADGGGANGHSLRTWKNDIQERLCDATTQVAKAIAYSLNAWGALVRFLDDGRLCMTNNAAERALRCIAVGRNNWTFAGSDAGGRRAAAIYTLIETAKLNDVDPQAWLTDVLARLQDHPARRIAELRPWNWKVLKEQQQAAA